MAKQTKEYSVAATRNTQQRKRLFINAWKAERGCRDCPEHDPVVLDCHHITADEKNPRLRGTDNHALKLWQLSWDDLEVELLKCVVLCANCHRREEHRQRG